MNRPALILIPVFFMLSCNSKDKSRSESNIRKEVLEIAVNYVKAKCDSPKETISQNGIVTISEDQVQFVSVTNNQERYVIDPEKITTGLINDDPEEDAIITINSYKGQYENMPEHLIMVNNDGKLILSRTVESDMKVLEIKNGLITAEIYTKSRNSPLRDCDACKEVVSYRFSKGDLVIAEE